MNPFGQRFWMGAAGIVSVWAMIIVWTFRDFLLGPFILAHPDPLHFCFAVRHYFFTLLADGVLSWFYPDNSLGLSLVASPGYAILNPLFLLHTMLQPLAAWRLSFFLQHLLLASGWYAALGFFVDSRFARIATATLLLASGLIWSMHWHDELTVVMWSGWAVWAFSSGAKAPGRGGLLLLAGVLVALMFWSGDIFAGPLFLAMGMITALSPMSPSSNSVPMRRVLSNILLAAGLALILIAPMLDMAQQLAPLTARSEGMLLAERFSYSSHPIRLLDVLIAGVLPPLSSETFPIPSLRIGFGAWWYDSLSFGILATLLFCIGGYRGLGERRAQTIALLALGLVFAGLACGPHLPGGTWLWTHVPPLTLWRFPERLLKFSFFLGLPILAWGFAWFECRLENVRYRHLLKMALLGLCIFEAHRGAGIPLMLPQSAFSAPGILRDLATDTVIARQGGARIMPCYEPLPGVTALGPSPTQSFDTRAWGVPMLAGSEAVQSLTLKGTSCDWVANPIARQWLGVTHFAHARTDSAGDAQMSSRYGLRKVGSTNPAQMFETYDIWTSDTSHPANALATGSFRPGQLFEGFNESYSMEQAWEEGLRDLSDGTLLIDPRYVLDHHGRRRNRTVDDQASFASTIGDKSSACREHALERISMDVNAYRTLLRLKADLSCRKLISVPWSFTPGWKLTVNGRPAEILRVGGLTMGFIAEPGPVEAEFSFDLPQFTLMQLAMALAVVVIMAASVLEFRRLLVDQGNSRRNLP